ncbi:MAG: hypothetical protein ACRD2T_11655, partial [Thermoanaerobaculia bacterium]
LGCLPPLPPEAPRAERKALPVVVDWDRIHPVNRFLVFTDLSIEESAVFGAGKGYRSLVDSDHGSIIGVVRYESPGGRPVPAILVGFDILKSNWPLGHYSFPIFFSNAVSWLGAGAEGRIHERSRTGEPLVHVPRPGDEVGASSPAAFRAPSGREIPAVRERNGSFSMGLAEEAGVYEFLLGGVVQARFPVALLSRRESKLAPLETLDLGDFSVGIASAVEERGRDLWKFLALAALGLLLAEWHLYNRRLF